MFLRLHAPSARLQWAPSEYLLWGVRGECENDDYQLEYYRNCTPRSVDIISFKRTALVTSNESVSKLNMQGRE